MTARKAAFTALRKVSVGAYSSITLDEVLSGAGMEQRDNALASLIFYGVLENEILLDYIIGQQIKKGQKIEKNVRILLRMGLYQLAFMDRIPHSAAINETVELAKKNGLARASGFINAVLRGYLRRGEELALPDRETQPQLYLSLKYSCPMWLTNLWRESYGDDICEDILQSLPGRPPVYVRANTLYTTPSQLCEMLTRDGVTAQEMDSPSGAVMLSDTGDIERLEAFAQGLMHVQDVSSQLCCMMLGAKPGETVLDVCSAPGGKAYTIAELMGDNGRIIACDIHPHRVGLIESGAKRLKLHSIDALVRDALIPDDITADRVLCDVPCSGLGIIRRKPDIKNKRQSDIEQLPKLQYDILSAAAQSLKKGGTVIYSTCTLSCAENGDVVERFLREHPEFEPYPM
ncbi:MAG: 16S rRNA (cytosine(967)-C(5))-methyltransferase RsmB, partial [Clostridia bacterium]|nr:16S rRNA (cytosine(967)-C(5))-methyltransferase RsmB [Clostridia bacterium]